MSTAGSIGVPEGMSEAHLTAFGLDPREVPGNATPETKELVAKWLHVFAGQQCGFAHRVGKLLELTEVSIREKAEEPSRKEGRVVCEMTVSEDMLNVRGQIHGGCIIYLVDICSTLAASAMSFAAGGTGNPGVSQTINTTYHAPASLGDRIKLINTSITIGGRTATASTEIWDMTHRRLIATATQVKMQASAKL
ncbi:hypothetical protein SERLA73DRAFT_120777 [Serpula lacrymans var. lacrymans S7.3]|uniref:Thioesterase domain-containing protein n=2 Tax=Serpula lacrymans var. lacrymans TaxID=341189 RepID=F8PPY3_SERL3|nr:uncharacterized protein SERLADRAFT_461778 [Serpula lacrymans var. lacrymans S7.9]EGO02137.1 hypothetical protein SERLA73DRAFT_120777 [Serpula lacrymans var. lacrymans S7.3]EGO27761.1 hypothetical protein SERLADRAFT_461778 [Serpula lacrymans var. lacrymans S7.9]